MPGRYPGRLIATHINDNLGIRDYGGRTFWYDDLHLLPFDGVGDWEDIARRLAVFDGPLTFELTTHSKPDRHENDKYAKLTPEEYLAEAYARACRVATLVQKTKKA
ncbi:MAG: sugar phosphate isomerase/epimerase, partial [Clostridiales bacterium]|nr:sugar phosphate isomerase/epimerase [Clostridiales bacterium]